MTETPDDRRPLPSGPRLDAAPASSEIAPDAAPDTPGDGASDAAADTVADRDARTDGSLPEPGSTPPRGRRHRRRIWGWVVLGVLALAVGVAARWNLDFYALEPGSAQSVQSFITVPPSRSHPVTHPVLLTDVQIGRVTALTYLYYKLQGNAALEPLESVTGGTPPSQLTAQGMLEMSQAEDDAKAAALRHLGYSVSAIPAGAAIFGTYPGTPAYGVLHVGDVVTAVDGAATPSAAALVAALSHHHAGQTVHLTVLRQGKQPTVPVAITLRSTEVDVGGGRVRRLDLGIYPVDQVDYTFPFPVRIDVTNIGGPSAGLAMTLGVIDALTTGSVTGGQTVAATGTIDSKGDVGDVGGVAQKTVAVERAGATIFLVPPTEYKAALSKDRPGLHIYKVATLDQALRVLAAHGGRVPLATASHASSAAPSTAG